MSKVLLLVLINSQLCFGQRSTGYSETPVGIKVVVSNFHKSPPACGAVKTTSIYEAEVIDSLSVLQGSTILICVECKAEAYPFVKGKHFIVTLGDECAYFKGMYNFTDRPEEILKIKKKHSVLSLVEYSVK